MAARALSGLPQRDRQYRSSGPSVFVSIVGAPRQSILRPSRIEDPEFRRELEKRALFDDPSIFDTREGIEPSIEDHSLRLHQPHQSIALSEEGSLLVSLSLPRSDRVLSALIEEDVAYAISKALRFAGQVLDVIDPTERLSHIAVAVGIDNSGGGEWRTRAQQERNPNSMRMMSDDSLVQVTLSPPDRSRASLRQNHSEMSQDLTVLLRRHFQT
jgi:hypothetical protein